MKILIAVTSPLSYLLTKGQLSFLVSKGYKVVFVCSLNSNIESQVKSEGASYRSINLVREISLFDDIKAIRAAIKILKDEKPEIVNASTPKAGLIFMIASRFVKVYPIFTLRGIRSDTLSGIKKHIVRLTEIITCKMAKKVVVIAPSLREYAIAEGIVSRKKTAVLGNGSSNGINYLKFTNTKEVQSRAKELRVKYGIAEDSCVFGCLGRVVKDKGIVEVYNAFKIVQNKYKNSFLVLTGLIELEGDPIPDQILTEMKSNRNVIFIDHCAEVINILSMYDILILFSFREGFGNVVLEASSMEKAVIVSNIPGAQDTVEDGVTGYLVPPKDFISLANKMELYIINSDVRKAHGEAGRKRVINYFSSKLVWESQHEFYQSLNV